MIWNAVSLRNRADSRADPQARIGPLVGQRRDDDYDVLENGVLVGRIFKVPAAPHGRPGCGRAITTGEIRRAAHGYEQTREAAMAGFAKSWRKTRHGHARPSSGNLPPKWGRNREATAMLAMWSRHERLYVPSEPRRRGARAGRG